MKIPVIINNRDLLTWPRAMVEHLRTYDDVGEIIILDNGSSYPPLWDWYRSKPAGIRIEYQYNIGHFAPWVTGLVDSLDCEHYVVTDPDLGLELTPPDTLTVLRDKLTAHPEFRKIGLGLDWQIIPKDSPFHDNIMAYEGRRWNTEKYPPVDGIYPGALIDTTLAIYPKAENKYFIGGGSLTFPYVARHNPWYFTDESRENDPEYSYYIRNANRSCTYKTIYGL